MMKKDIQDFITIQKLKNGRIRICHNITNEGNIYKFLVELGFRQAKIDGKRVYFHRQHGEFEIVSIEDIRDAFYDFIDSEFYNSTNEISKGDILNWFLRDNPIRQNGLLEYYLKEELSDTRLQALKNKVRNPQRKIK